MAGAVAAPALGAVAEGGAGFAKGLAAGAVGLVVMPVLGAGVGVAQVVRGVAATPARAVKTEAALIGRPWNEATLQAAQTAMADEFSPLSDLRASADYRRTLLGQLLRRAWLESTGQATVRLEDLA